jgi:V-type ATPase 116 kDa subunit
MAVVEMCKLRLVGLKSEQYKVMDTLTRTHLFQPIPTAQIEGTGKTRDTSHLDKILKLQARLSFALQYLSDANAEAAGLIKRAKKAGVSAGFDYSPYKIGGRQIITYDDFYDCSAKEYELLNKCDALEKLSFEKAELKSEQIKIKNRIKALAPYENMPLKFSAAARSRSAVTIIAFSGGRNASAEALRGRFDVAFEQFPSDSGSALALVCLIDDETAVKSALAESGWSLCQFFFDATAADLIEADRKRLDETEVRLKEILVETLSYQRYRLEFATLYDFLGTDAEKFEAELEFAKTNSAYVLEGWVPAEKSEEIAEKVKSATDNVVVYLEKPSDDDIPPTLLDNPGLVKPYESITNMYSTPSYREKDPNFVMAIFFFIIFGIMMADAGYGLVLALACTFIVRFTHMEKGIKSLSGVFAMGGVSALVWGAMFGSWFGLEILPPLWFNPLEEPIMLLAVCLVLGVLHLMTGYGYQGYYLIKKGKIFDAICDVGFIYLLFIGVALLALPMALPSLPAVVGDIGLYALLASLALIFLTSGRHKKGIFGKFFGGFGGLYGLVNLFSDVLSYARIFGIALAGGAIASAFNSILGVLAVSPVGIILAVILGIFLHVFNLLISLLGAYVHNARLQFLEFYGKFYTGEGKLFSPMGERTKYIRFV